MIDQNLLAFRKSVLCLWSLIASLRQSKTGSSLRCGWMRLDLPLP